MTVSKVTSWCFRWNSSMDRRENVAIRIWSDSLVMKPDFVCFEHSVTWWGPERKVSGCVSWAGLLARHANAHPRFERRRLVIHTAFFVKDV